MGMAAHRLGRTWLATTVEASMSEHRHLLALRAYVDELLAEGASIVSRRPLTLQLGQTRMRYSCGMLMYEDEIEEIELA